MKKLLICALIISTSGCAMDDDAIAKAVVTCHAFGHSAVPSVRPADGKVISIRCEVAQ